MAIAELVARVGFPTRDIATESILGETAITVDPIKQFTPEDASKLASRYLLHRWFFMGKKVEEMTEEEARNFGRMEVQEKVLTLIGHSILTVDRAPKIFYGKRIEVRKALDLNREDIMDLVKDYRSAYKTSLRGFFDARTLTNVTGRELTPNEAKIQGNRDELAAILNQLGQGNLVRRIAGSPDPDLINLEGKT